MVHVPESTKKPHIVTEWNSYYLRINDSSKSANHSQIRDMFELSKRRTDEFNDFIVKKNLFDEELKSFGRNKNSKELISEVPIKFKRPTPLVIFSLFPKYPNDEKINIPFNVFQSWLRRKATGYKPSPTFSICNDPYEYDLRLDGVVLKNKRNNQVTSYFEILNNGYVEAGFSSSFIMVYSNQSESSLNGMVALTPLIVYEMTFLGFAREFCELANYYDEVMLQVSFVDTLDFMAWGLNSKFRMGWHGERPSNKQHNNFKLTYSFNPKTLTDEDITKIASQHSEKICRAFGLRNDYCFVDNQLSLGEMSHFYL